MADTLIGRRFGAFHIDEPLGKGGMGAVYRGRDMALDRPVAVKTLAPHLAEDAEYVERFVREARTAAKINHPNVVQIYGAGSEGGVAYMALELVPGCSLFELFKDNRPFPLPVACRLIRDAARGLVAAHALGIVHRDLKPENILVTPEGNPKLADFGLAFSQTGQRITTSGMFLGTPQYSSPEQCNAQELTPATDYYSLGVVLYELISGKPPFEAPTPLSLFKKILTDPIPPLSPEREDIPPSLREVVRRLLEKEPADRYASGEELVKDLETVVAGFADTEPPGDFRWPSERIIVPSAETVLNPERETPAVNRTPAETPAVTSEDATRTVALPKRPFAEAPGAKTPAQPPQTPPPQAPAAAPPAPVAASKAPALVAALVAFLVVGVLFFFKGGAPAGPVHVSVLQWENSNKNPEFEWLVDAIPEFVLSEFGGASGIKHDPADYDVMVRGRFYSPEGSADVSITTTLDYSGGSDTVRARFARERVLEELEAHAAKVRDMLAMIQPRRRDAPGDAPAAAEAMGDVAMAPEQARSESELEEKAVSSERFPAPSAPPPPPNAPSPAEDDFANEVVAEDAQPTKSEAVAGGESVGSAPVDAEPASDAPMNGAPMADADAPDDALSERETGRPEAQDSAEEAVRVKETLAKGKAGAKRDVRGAQAERDSAAMDGAAQDTDGAEQDKAAEADRVGGEEPTGGFVSKAPKTLPEAPKTLPAKKAKDAARQRQQDAKATPSPTGQALLERLHAATGGWELGELLPELARCADPEVQRQATERFAGTRFEKIYARACRRNR